MTWLPMRRVGFELQFLLLVHPEFMDFDRKTHKKLGRDLVPLCLDNPAPDDWEWTGDPVDWVLYREHDRPGWGDWWQDDHHRFYRDSIGYRTCWVYQDTEKVGYQLELVSKPLPVSRGADRFVEDMRRTYWHSLPELLSRGVVCAWHDVQQGIREQYNVEIFDAAHDREPPLQRLAWWALGLWVLLRQSPPLDPGPAAILAQLRDDVAWLRPRVTHYDLLRNVSLLVDAYFAHLPPSLNHRWLARLLEPAGTAVLTACYDNDLVYHYVHGVAELEAAQMRRLSPRDFALLRSLGIDSMFLDVLTGRPQPHLTKSRDKNLRLLRDGLDCFVDTEALGAFVHNHVHRAGSAPDRATLPLFHLRKKLTEGTAYIELRHMYRLKFREGAPPAYQARYANLEVTGPRPRTLQVVHAGHLWPAAMDLVGVFEVALVLGRELWHAIQRGDHAIRRRDGTALDRHFAPLAQRACAERGLSATR